MPDSATTTPVALPGACDVAVIGAGPAGSAAAWQLARRGLDVVLVDQHVFPRDKVCGDGLIPDAHAALARMGVLEEVMARARRVPFVRCTGPRGRHVDVPGRLAVLPRVQLDHLLLQCAERAGARCLMPARFEAPLLEGGGRVVGVRLRVGQETHALAARWVVLATGASVQGLLASGLCERRTPSGIAMRGYVRSEIMVGRITGLEIFWHPRLAGGYGWIFPAPEGCFNIGAGLTGSHAVERGDGGLRMQDINLKRLFEAFCEVYAPARELMATGALLIYALVNFAVFKWLAVTLTLPAITGFLLSTGMAVDANILVFERMKEELRAGSSLRHAIRTGFSRAWTSIRDSNIATLVICFILWTFGRNFGASAVQGFAITLAIGVMISMFTAVIVTRTFVGLVMGRAAGWLRERRWLLGA